MLKKIFETVIFTFPHYKKFCIFLSKHTHKYTDIKYKENIHTRFFSNLTVQIIKVDSQFRKGLISENL